MDRTPPPFDVAALRRDFPMLAQPMNGNPLVYLDSAATAQKPQSVIDAICRYYQAKCGTVHRAVYALAEQVTHEYAAVREKVRSFLRAPDDGEILFTGGTTAGLNLLALAVKETWIQEGDEIIISAMEHHSNLIPWQLVCKEKRARLRVVPINDSADLLLEAYEQQLSSKTKLVSFAHMGNVTGTINPVKKLVEMAHRVGAKVVLDGAQAAAHLPVNLEELNPDFYVCSAHKMYGPTGVGILYGKRAHFEELSPVFGGSDMVHRVTLEGFSTQPPPLKFEPGTPPIASVLGLGAAIDYLEGVGRAAIAKWETVLNEYARKQLEAIEGVTRIGNPKECGGILSFTLDAVHALDLATMLSIKGIAIRTGHLCASPLLQRFGVTTLNRISFGLYTTYSDIDRFITALKETMALLSPELFS